MTKTYSEKLRSPKWQKRRLEIMSRDKFACKYCKDKETQLNVHHSKYEGAPWEAEDIYLETVCEHCHKHVCHNDNIESLLSVEKLITEWAIVYMIACEEKDILLTIDNSGIQNVLIFQKNSFILKKLAKLNTIKNGRR